MDIAALLFQPDKEEVKTGDDRELKLTKIFERIASECETKRTKQVTAVVEAGGAHRTLCDTLLSYDIKCNRDRPLRDIYNEVVNCRPELLSSEPVVKLFCDQWQQYIADTFAGSHEKALKMASMQPHWFDSCIARVTFDNVFANPLWENVARDRRSNRARFDTLQFSTHRRQPEELLAKRNRLQFAGSLSTATPCAGILMEHVGLRRQRARTAVYLKRFGAHMRDQIQPVDAQLTAAWEMVDAKDVLGPALQYRLALETQAGKKLEHLSTLPPNEVKALVDGDWVKNAKTVIATTQRNLDAAQQEWRQRYLDEALRVFLVGWCDQMTRRLDSLSRLDKTLMPPLQRILDDWPVLDQEEEEDGAHKRLRRQQQQHFESKQQDDSSVSGKIEELLEQHTNMDADDFLTELLPGCVHLLEQNIQALMAKTDSKALAAQRTAMMVMAVEIDLENFKIELNERMRLNPHLMSGGGGSAGQLMLLAKPVVSEALSTVFEAQVIEEALRHGQQFKQGYYELFTQIATTHWRTHVYERLQRKLGELQAFSTKLRGQVIKYEPWLDAQLTVGQQEQLRALLGAGSTVPLTISGALMQCEAWFERFI